MKIIYTENFARKYKQLPFDIKFKAEKQERIFRKNPFDRRLKTHKLKGKFQGFWSFSITYKYRIIFEFGERNIVYFHSVGTHRIY